MEEILKTKILEFDKSIFIIDLVKSYSGKQYIKLKQNYLENNSFQEIKINDFVLKNIIVELQNLQKLINEPSFKVHKINLEVSQQKEIVNRYLKGIKLKDLELQFDCKKEDILKILRLYEIVIIPEIENIQIKKFRFYRKKK